MKVNNLLNKDEQRILEDSLYSIRICNPVFFLKNETYKINGRTLQNMAKLLRLLENKRIERNNK